MSCIACGKTFRSMSAEAKHRHSFPALCKRNRRFKAWEEEIAKERAAKAAAAPPPQEETDGK